MSLPFLPYAKQSIEEADIHAMMQAMKGEVITRGYHVDAFEQAVADYCGARYAVAFNSASTALEASYFAARISQFDRLVSTPNTFISTVGTAMRFGAYPHFIDIDRETGNFDLQRLKEKLDFQSTRGKLVITPVHFSGIAVDMQALDQLIRDPNAIVIEDAAHALGSSYPDGKKVGCCAWSQMTIFSFHPAKTITTGEGGIALTNDYEFYHRLRLFRNNGIEKDPLYLERDNKPWYYEVHALTGNFNFTDFQAALGLSQFRRLDTLVKKRQQLVKHYRKLLQGIPGIELFSNSQDHQTGFHLFVVQIDFDSYGTTREKVMLTLRDKGIGTQVHYIPVYQHPVFLHKQGDISDQFPEMETYYRRALSLPLYYDLTEEGVNRVCSELKRVLKI